ncbi:MAG: hypothetical protein DCF26_04515 [Burkholderiales bacterium]|nr:MAG: hypothetical protein DCF26_04515 [Burkholderiales bacterium]
MREQFDKLMKAFCLLVKLPDAQPFIEGASFDVDGTNCAILFNEKVDANQCFVYADFGQPPPENETQVFYELLRQNFAAAADTGPTYTISTLTGHVVHVEKFELATTGAEALADAMANIAARASDWRKTRFLTGDFVLPRQA